MSGKERAVNDMMNNASDIGDYVTWLIGPSNLRLANSIDPNSITNLIVLLSNVQFDCTLHSDSPRVEDAFTLRDEYVEQAGSLESSDRRLYGPASVLEVLVVMAIRFDMEVYGDPGEPKPDVLFLGWLNNLGIVVPDAEWSVENSNNILSKLSKWMQRSYGDDGKGSIFPLKSVTFGFSESDMWRQMHIFYYENQ